MCLCSDSYTCYIISRPGWFGPQIAQVTVNAFENVSILKKKHKKQVSIGWHVGAVGSAVASQQVGPEFDSQPGCLELFLCGPCMFSSWVSSHSPKTYTADATLPPSCKCVFLCVCPVMEWWPVQSVSCLSLERLQHLCGATPCHVDWSWPIAGTCN